MIIYMKTINIIILCLVIIGFSLCKTSLHKESFINFDINDINWKNIKLVKSANDRFKDVKSDYIVKYYNLKENTIHGIETKLKNIGFLV